MTPSNLEKIFGPDVEDPIDIESEPEDGDLVVVGVHNNLVVEQCKMVMTSGCGRFEGEGRSYQDRMFVTLSFSDPELSASHLCPPQPKRAQSAPRLRASLESQAAIQSKIVNCWSRSKSEDNLGSFHCQTGCASEMSEQSSDCQNDGTNLSDFTSVFTNETEPEFPTLLPGQIKEETEPDLPTQTEEELEEELDEKTTGAFIKDNKKYKRSKRTWWRKICLLCMSKQ